MSDRNIRLYLDDILDSSKAIHDFLEDMSFEAFCHDRRTYSATIREFIVIGEAISTLMNILETRFPDYEWRMIKDFRNFIVHQSRCRCRKSGFFVSVIPDLIRNPVNSTLSQEPRFRVKPGMTRFCNRIKI